MESNKTIPTTNQLLPIFTFLRICGRCPLNFHPEMSKISCHLENNEDNPCQGRNPSGIIQYNYKFKFCSMASFYTGLVTIGMGAIYVIGILQQGVFGWQIFPPSEM
jgi:hypothetical protein